MFLITACSVVLVLSVGFMGSPSGAAGALSSPPTVAATNWTDFGAAPGAGDNGLLAVSCTSSSFCVAVGTQKSSTGGAQLIEQWNGTSWTVMPGVSFPLSASNVLDGVSCVGSDFCLTVGGAASGPIAEAWNGSTWSQVTVPSPNGSGVLYSVSCVAATTCETFGTDYAGGVTMFGDQWNGSTLSLEPAQTPSGPFVTESGATGMDCKTATWCVAVGSVSQDSPFAEMWNGTSWVLMNGLATPQGASSSKLTSVSCVGTTFCQAVGQLTASGRNQSLVESWNGSTWVQSPNVPDTSPSLNQMLDGVDCFSATTCTAVGDASTSSGPSPATLAMNWNGSSWSITATPNPGADSTQFAAVSCLTDWACVAVGKAVSSSQESYAASAPIARSGYRFVASDGGIFSYGAPFLGSMGGQRLNKPIVGMAVMPGGDGYAEVASDGGLFNFGSAPFDGSAGSLTLDKPVVGMAFTADGGGYYLVASDGGLFAYGDAQFYGSMGGKPLNAPIVGMALTPDGKGYDEVASDGGIFTFGDAAFDGSAGGLHLNKPVVGMSAPVSGGYYLVASDGGIFSYPSSLPFYGSTGSITLNKPVVAMATVHGGYYLSASDGGVFSYPSSLPFLGSMGGQPLNAPIVGMAS